MLYFLKKKEDKIYENEKLFLFYFEMNKNGYFFKEFIQNFFVSVRNFYISTAIWDFLKDLIIFCADVFFDLFLYQNILKFHIKQRKKKKRGQKDINE